MQFKLPKRIAVAGLAVGLAGSLVGAGTIRAGATSELLGCTASGTADVAPNSATNPTAFDWSIQGTGSCLDLSFPLQNAKSITFTGSGTSANLGLCSQSLLMNLSLMVTVTLTDEVTKAQQTIQETWGLFLSNYPIATPFLVNKPSTSGGAGTILSRVLGTCPPGGTDSANFAWTQSIPT
jgi:hypothetical protein